MRKIAIILNLNKQYDRYLVSGIARYAKENDNWTLHIEDDPELRIPDFETWDGDGIIADLDDEKVCSQISNLDIPIVGLGGGYYQNTQRDIPYAYTDNKAIAELAAEHLHDCGFRNFAFCNFAATKHNIWAAERANAFKHYIKGKGRKCSILTQKKKKSGQESLLEELMKWLSELPKPVGIMAVNDSKARNILEACRRLNLRVPDDIAVIGVDDDPMMCELANPSLSSVIQGTDKLGYEAAKLLDRLLLGEKGVKSIVIEPQGINIRQSTDILTIDDPLIAEALTYIRINACNSIRVEDVAKHTSVSRSTLEKRFIKVLERSVHEEITKIKVKTACRLLTETPIPLKAISEKAGFNTVQYMTRVIKKNTGKTPKILRMTRNKFL